jgi:hypothetical protein
MRPSHSWVSVYARCSKSRNTTWQDQNPRGSLSLGRGERHEITRTAKQDVVDLKHQGQLVGRKLQKFAAASFLYEVTSKWMG